MQRTFTGNVEEDLLSVTSVHPIREGGVKELLRKANSSWEVVEKLLNEGKLIELEYEGHYIFILQPAEHFMLESG